MCIVQIMATPLQLWTIYALSAWGSTRVDKPSMMQLHELKVLKAGRRELPDEEDDEGGGTEGGDGQQTGDGRKGSAQEQVERLLSQAASARASGGARYFACPTTRGWPGLSH